MRDEAEAPAPEAFQRGNGGAARPLGRTAQKPPQRWVPLLLCVLLGAALGLVGARYLLVGSALSLLPWGIAAVVIGSTSAARRDVLARGGCYGFVLAFVFMLGSYSGRAAVTAELLLFAVLGLVGAVCAVLLAYAGHLVRVRAGRP